jgi:threonine/homoserine/homoserine lactone efflux protein
MFESGETTTGLIAGLGIGVALAGAPGPVQAVILAESARGGVRRGLGAVAGASLSFGSLLVGLALGLSALAVTGPALRLLQVIGGAFLVWLAIDGLRSAPNARGVEPRRRSLPPAARGSLAVLLNPGAWLFLGAVASPLIGASAQAGGTPAAVVSALALMAGAAAGDAALALVAGLGLRRAGRRTGALVQRTLAVVLAALGAWLILMGVLG